MNYEYKTLTFSNNKSGMQKKQITVTNLKNNGWEVESETINGATTNGEQACCLAILCLPCGFLAMNEGFIEVNLKRKKNK